MVLIGVDPHKASHTAVVVDGAEQQLGVVQVRADRRQLERLLRWAQPFPERTWAIESAGGLGYLLAQQLVAADEHVLDVPPTLSARVRLLGSGRSSKNDPNDALSTAIAALRHPGLRVVVREDHAMVLRLLADRHHDLSGLRTQAICRLHALVATLVPGSALKRDLTAKQASLLLRGVRPAGAVEAERRRLVVELIADVRRLDANRTETKRRIIAAVTASGSTVTEVYGVGPVVAATVIGHSGDVSRFASSDRFASYNGTAPIEASSGPKARHRLNPRGNRRINHALHVAAITQIRNDTPGRAYFRRKVDEGKTKKEAIRALKRRVSDAVFRQLLIDAARLGR